MFSFSKRWIKLLFLLPSLVFFVVYTLYPVLSSLLISFEHKSMFGRSYFVGLANFAKFFTDENLPIALTNTAIVTVGDLLLILPISFLIGLLLNKEFRGNDFVRLITFTPYILSPIMTSLVWFFVVDPGIGLLDNMLKSIGLQAVAFQWIGGEFLTPYTVAFLDSWKAVGFYSVLFLAGLKMIPREFYEAATIDGASNWQKMQQLTIPLLKETTKICVVYVVINGIKTFETVYVLTNGGPNFRSHVIATYIYYQEFANHDFGYGSALALLMFVVIMGMTIGFLSATRKRVEM